MSIKVDTNSFTQGIARLGKAMAKAALKGVNDVASEILRLSEREVPHDIGLLQASGHVEPSKSDEVTVGYNKVYAARLHEHPEYMFQKGRKGKYLEDPIKNNTRTFIKFIEGGVNAEIR